MTIELASPEVLPERRFGRGGVVAVLAGEDRLASKSMLHDLHVDTSERQLRGIDIGSRRFIFAAMRGFDSKQGSMFCLKSPETMVPASHPIREIERRTELSRGVAR